MKFDVRTIDAFNPLLHISKPGMGQMPAQFCSICGNYLSFGNLYYFVDGRGTEESYDTDYFGRCCSKLCVDTWCLQHL